ncbi:MAG: putative 4-hydroxybenzoate polyprenyltransferase, partial [Chloroflexi bacterium]|nr:putative 4-hydroxybenzoate polyprenyltransferase [Chloroflexota bacterium]
MTAASPPPLARPWSLMGRVGILLDSIRFEHSIFALPFAYLGMVLAADGLPAAGQIIWITVAMVAARTLAMSSNRLLDRVIDAQNPRTARRALPVGRLRPIEMALFAGVSLIVFLWAASMLNEVALALAPVAAIVVVTYSYAKRFTWLGHFWLGFADGIAPAGGWVAVSGTLPLEAVLLAFAVTTWVAGFDLIYQCMDRDFDIAHGLHSIPAKWGNAASLRWAKTMHVLTIGSLIALGILMELAWPFHLGVAVAAALLVYEHSLVRANDLSKVGVAFFNINGYIAITVFAATTIAV